MRQGRHGRRIRPKRRGCKAGRDGARMGEPARDSRVSAAAAATSSFYNSGWYRVYRRPRSGLTARRSAGMVARCRGRGRGVGGRTRQCAVFQRHLRSSWRYGRSAAAPQKKNASPPLKTPPADPNKPFWADNGSPTVSIGGANRDPVNTPNNDPEVSGILAGRIIDSYQRPVASGSVQVIEMASTAPRGADRNRTRTEQPRPVLHSRPSAGPHLSVDCARRPTDDCSSAKCKFDRRKRAC